MINDITKQWNEISKTVIQSMEELSNINTNVIEKLTEQQLAVLNTCMEASQQELNLTTTKAHTKDPQALLVAQTDLVAQCNNKLMAIVQSTGKILKDCNNEIINWTDKSMNISQESTAKPAPKAKIVKKAAKEKTSKKG